jgi:hypothetical protein
MMQRKQLLSRREIFRRCAISLGGLSLAGLPGPLSQMALGKEHVQGTHHAPRAKRVIFLFMHGGPSHVDTFDYKPKLQADDGKDLPFDKAANIDAQPKLMKSPWKFAQHGESGNWVSQLLPHTA